MSASFLSPSRTVLLIGDEALYIYKINFKGAVLVDRVPWQADDFEDICTELIRKDCGGRPVLILNNMTDQHYKGGQKMPQVGPLDKFSVMRRRLHIAFPNHPIRGALPMQTGNEKKINFTLSKPQKTEMKQYLFAALPMSEQIVKTLEAVKKSMVYVTGLYLLPVESSNMVRLFSEKLAGKKGTPSRWTIFIGQHHDGALRQVITRDGQLAMTRMTHIVDSDEDPKRWAEEVNQEFNSTVGYLSRFGYSSRESTDIFVIANQQAGQILEDLIEMQANFRAMTVNQAAGFIGQKIGVQEDGRYADPLHIGWIGRKSRFLMPMDAAEVKKIHRPRQAIAAAIFLLFLGGGYLGWESYNAFSKNMELTEKQEKQSRQLAMAQQDEENAKKQLEEVGFDINQINGVINTYKKLEGQKLYLLTFLDKLKQALGEDLVLDSIDIVRLEEDDNQDSNARNRRRGRRPAATQSATETISGSNRLQATLSLSFPPPLTREIGIREVDLLSNRLRDVLPDYEVILEKQVARPDYQQNVSGVIGEGKSAREIVEEDDYKAEVIVKGPNK